MVTGTVGGTHTDTESGERPGSHRKAAPVASPAPTVEMQSVSAKTWEGNRPSTLQNGISARWPWGTCDMPALGKLMEGASLLAQWLSLTSLLQKGNCRLVTAFAQDLGLWSLNSLLRAMFKFLT